MRDPPTVTEPVEVTSVGLKFDACGASAAVAAEMQKIRAIASRVCLFIKRIPWPSSRDYGLLVDPQPRCLALPGRQDGITRTRVGRACKAQSLRVRASRSAWLFSRLFAASTSESESTCW